MSKFINTENWQKLLNYLRPWNYFGHPELKLKNPRNKKELLLEMRDMRLWLLENSFSSRKHKVVSDLERINRELLYIQGRALFLPFVFWFGALFYLKSKRNAYWNSHNPLLDRPVLQSQTGGSTIFADVVVPKMVASDYVDHSYGL